MEPEFKWSREIYEAGLQYLYLMTYIPIGHEEPHDRLGGGESPHKCAYVVCHQIEQDLSELWVTTPQLWRQVLLFVLLKTKIYLKVNSLN